MNTIGAFNIDLTDLPAASETRNFTISGSAGAVFSLEVKNEDSYYYNFITKAFQAGKARLDNIVITSGVYRNSITFPTITDDDHYDFYLFADKDTQHTPYNEVRFGDGTVDINSSSGSNSKLIKKIIYQYTNLTLSLRTYSPTSAFTLGSPVNDDFTISSGRVLARAPFTISCTSASTTSYRIIKQPTPNDILSFVTPTVGSAPEKLPGENIYPAVSNTDTVNGDVTSGGSAPYTVTMDTAVASKVTVGDRITGNTDLNAATVTVVALTGTYTFTMSEDIAIADGITLSFSNRMNYQWPLDDISNAAPGMIVVANTNVTTNTSVGEYKDTVTIFQDTENEKKIIKNRAPALNTKGALPTITKGLVTTQTGNVVFNKQQVLAFAGDVLKLGGYGENQILNVHGYDVRFTDLAISYKPVTTTTTAASYDSTSVVVAARDGIMNSVSTVSGIGIDPSTVPMVSSGANATGAGTIVLDKAQTLESGVTLTFAESGKRVVITGNIEVLKAGTESTVIYFDVEKLLTSA